VDDAQNFHAIEQRNVQDENSLEPCQPECPQFPEAEATEPGAPPHVGLNSQECESFVCCRQEAVANFSVRDSSVIVIVSLVVKILVGFGPDYVADRGTCRSKGRAAAAEAFCAGAG
jgi:hypothetical protein